MRLPALLLLLGSLACAAEPIHLDPEPTANAPYLGVYLDEVDDALNYHLGLANDLGILVSEVMSGSPADKMGLKQFDVIIACDGEQVYTPRAFQNQIAGKKIDDPVNIIVRRGANEVTLNGNLAARPPEAMRPTGPGGIPDPMREIEDMQRRMQEQLQNHMRQPPQQEPPQPMSGQRSGKIKQPDGSVLEWSVEEDKPGESM